jgi:hypothetical protein
MWDILYMSESIDKYGICRQTTRTFVECQCYIIRSYVHALYYEILIALQASGFISFKYDFIHLCSTYKFSTKPTPVNIPYLNFFKLVYTVLYSFIQ